MRYFWGQLSPLGLGIAAFTLLADQAHKVWMLYVYDIGAKRTVQLAPFFDLVLVWNQGVSYGLLQQKSELGRWALILFAFASAIALIVWLAFVGLLMATGTLAVISWAEHVHGLDIARTMGMVTFALYLLFFSIEAKNERDSAFSLDTFSDKTFVITTSVSFVLLVLSTVLSIFQTVMKTVTLDVRQWLICTAAALSVVAAAEIRKAVRSGTAAT